MHIGQEQDSKTPKAGPLVPRANPTRSGPPVPARVMPPRPASFVFPGVRPPAQRQVKRQTAPFVKAPTPPGMKEPVMRGPAPPVYRPFAAAHVQPKAVPGIKPPVPPSVFRPQSQALAPRLAPRVTTNVFRINPPGFQNRATVQRSCLFSWCFGGGSGDGDKDPPKENKSEKDPFIPKKKMPKNVTVPEGFYKEIHEGEMATAEYITTCTIVYVRNTTGRVVVYHWPKTVLHFEYQNKMKDAIETIGTTKNVTQIILFTKIPADDLVEYLKKYTTNIQTVTLASWKEPMVTFSGEQWL